MMGILRALRNILIQFQRRVFCLLFKAIISEFCSAAWFILTFKYSSNMRDLDFHLIFFF